jgi:hypothetical protein
MPLRRCFKIELAHGRLAAGRKAIRQRGAFAVRITQRKFNGSEG